MSAALRDFAAPPALLSRRIQPRSRDPYGYLERNGAVHRIPWFTVWRRVSPQVPWRYVAE